MKYKVGDKVRIKSSDWYNENKNNKGIIVCGSESFTHPMSYFCNKVVSIITIQDNCYRILEDDGDWYWTDEMIEGLVEELLDNDMKEHQRMCDEIMAIQEIEPIEAEIEETIYLPEGYIFKDENGNVINATKIVLEKKKKEYPNNFYHCVITLGLHSQPADASKYKTELIRKLQALLVCRDSYWKIAGEEMGLGKPWKPDHRGDFEHGAPIKYVIYNIGTHIVKERKSSPNHTLSFPTAEMRDAFYENFKEEIEICKELL